MQEVLRFLSNDAYSFHFVPLKADRKDQTPYFEFHDQMEWPFHKPDRVLMFSGGLDSLAGIVETAASGGKSVLVSHRPVSTLYARQKKLFGELQKKFPGQLMHIPVWINNIGEMSDLSGSQDIILNKLDEIVRTLGARVNIQAQSRKARATPSFPTKRDTILFAAIVRDLEGLQYCIFLDRHRVKPKWSEDGPNSYRESYLARGSYPKKVQDEKSRAKQRMSKHPDSVLMEAFVTYVRSEFDELSFLLNSRNSRDASKN
jgi:hypothetical protein